MACKVSVIIPVYNNECEIERAIKSVLYQTTKDFEIIIIDGESTDNTLYNINKVKDDRIKVYHEKHNGVSFARNLGASTSKANLIAFLDADDEWLEYHLETILNLRNEYPEAGIYFTGYNFKNKHKNVEENKIETSKNMNILIRNIFKYMDQIVIPTSCVAINKNIFNEMKGFNINARWGEDEDLFLRIALKYPFAYNPIKDVNIYQNYPKEKMYSRIIKTNIHPFIISYKKLLKENNIPEYLKKDVKEVVEFYQIASSKYNLDFGNFSIAKNILDDCHTVRYKWKKRYQLLWVYLPPPLKKIIFKTLPYELLKSLT